MRGPHPPEKWKRIGKAYQYILAPLLLYLNIFFEGFAYPNFLKKTRVNLTGLQEAQVNCVYTSLSLSLSLLDIVFPFVLKQLFLSPRHCISIFFKTLCFYYFVWSYKNWTEFGFYAKSLSGFWLVAWVFAISHNT